MQRELKIYFSLYHYKTIRILLFVTTVLASIFTFGQEKNLQVENLINKADEHYKKLEDLKALEYAKKAYDVALEKGTDDQIAESAFYISTSLIAFQSYEEALKYVKVAYENCPEKNIRLLSQIIHSESLIYLYLGLYDESLKKSNLAIRYYKKLEPVKASEGLFEVYQNIAGIFIDKNQLDSAIAYKNKSKKILFSRPEKDTYNYRAAFYFHQSQALIDSGKIDSAMFYTYKAVELRKKYHDPMVFFEHITLGDCFYTLKDYPQALENYLKAVENLKNYRHYENDLLSTYETISQLYRDMGNPAKEKEYLQLYTDKQFEINTNQKRSLDYVMNEILNKKTDKFTSTQNKLIIVVIAITLVALIALWFYRKAKISKEKSFAELTKKESVVQQLNVEVEKSASEIQILEIKINESYDEILQMAKDNDPQFWFRFQEVYPEFSKNLLMVNSKLTVSELTLAGYIALGFTTKEIADITSRAFKTVESTRYNLRKKLQLPSEINLQTWLTERLKSI